MNMGEQESIQKLEKNLFHAVIKVGDKSSRTDDTVNTDTATPNKIKLPFTRN